MARSSRMPALQADLVRLAGGMDATVSPLFAPNGTPRVTFNYEASVNGGVRRIGGYEPFDGRASPSDAQWVLLECSGGITGVALDDTVTGDTSGATGVCVYFSSTQIALTQVTGTFTTEVLEVGGSPIGTVTNDEPAIDGFVDNQASKGAADVYQALIGKVPGSGPIRGLAVHDDRLYAWRDNVGATALAMYKSSTSGWTLVPYLYELSFTSGSTQPAEGSTLTQGGVTATVRRVVLESGAWGSSTAAGRYIITQPSGGSFSAGALSTAGAGTVPAAGTGVYHGTQITMSPGGRVRTDRYNFGGTASTLRLYGCDGVNRPFELGNDYLVPLTTGMSTFPTCIRAHKFHLFLSYEGSLQHSGTGLPYEWDALVGAGEIATGDTITNLISIGGSESNAALMVMCRNSMHVLYGNSAAEPWRLITQSRISGGHADSAQDIGGVIAYDAAGVVRYPTSDTFGNFLWDRMSLKIEPLVRGKEAQCSVYVPGLSMYRLFFTDGTAVAGFVRASGTSGRTANMFDWSTLVLPATIVAAVNGEIDGVARTFYGDDDGWVYEADKGRSFAGEAIQYGLVLCPLSQGSAMTLKAYRSLQLEVTPQSACTLYTTGEFTDSDQSAALALSQYGGGLRWDLSNFDESYWGVAETSRNLTPLEGLGSAVVLAIGGDSDNELPHTLTAVTILYLSRRAVR